MIRLIIQKNIYFAFMLILNILFLIFGTQQDLIYVSFFVVVSQLTRQCAEGLTQPRVLNNLIVKNHKSFIFFSDIYVTSAFSCIATSVLAYSLKVGLMTVLSTVPLMAILILMQPSLSKLNREGNYTKWNAVLLIPEILSFVIFVGTSESAKRELHYVG